MTRITRVTLLTLLLAAWVPCVQAQFAFSAGAMSDYRYRGISLSAERPVAQLSASWDDPSGLYAGVMLSGARLQNSGVDGQAILYAGLARRLGDGRSWEAGVSQIRFRGWVLNDYDYREFFVGLHLKQLSARLYSSPHYYGVGGRTMYAELNGSYPLTESIDVVAHAGYLHALSHQPYRRYFSPSRADARLGVNAALDAWTLQLAWVATRAGAAPYPGAGTGRARRLVLSGALAF